MTTEEDIKYRLANNEPMTDDDVLFVLQEEGRAIESCLNAMKFKFI
tara:strand:- start:965 stop:1102 length:138 start_codon:yes stop_codon:yes gene_type:complete